MTQTHAQIVLAYIETIRHVPNDEIDWDEFQAMRTKYPGEEYTARDDEDIKLMLFADRSVIHINTRTRQTTVGDPSEVELIPTDPDGNTLQ